MSGADGTVQSVDRVLDLVEALSAVPLGLPLSAAAAAAGLHPSTAYRLLNALADRGYAVKDALTGRYRLTLRFFEIGSRVSGTTDLLSAARPLLDALTDDVQETAHLVERDGADVVYLYKAEPYRQMVRMASSIGQRSPMYCTAVGKSILALLPEQEAREVWTAADVRPWTEKTITDWDRFLEELERTRRRGYALDDEESSVGVRCIGMAVLDWKGRPFAAVSVSAPVFRMDAPALEHLCPRLRKVADEVSRMMGKP